MKLFDEIKSDFELFCSNNKISWLKVIKYLFLTLVLLIATLLLFGFIYEEISRTNTEKYKPVGEMVDIGNGVKFHFNCVGSGSKTIILDAGIGDFSYSWSLVQSEIAKFARVCSYDRSGMGFSQVSSSEREIDTIADELIKLTEVKKINSFIYVGHSFSGMTALNLASRYPDKIDGLILIDPATNPGIDYQLSFLNQQERAYLEAYMQKESNGASLEQQHEKSVEQSKMQLKAIPFLSRFGLLRSFLQSSVLESTIYKYLPKDLKKSYKALLFKEHNIKAVVNEYILFTDNIESTYSKKYDFKDLPMLVITAEKLKTFYADKEVDDAPELVRIINKIHKSSQKDLLNFSSEATQVIVKNSGHYVQIDQPIPSPEIK